MCGRRQGNRPATMIAALGENKCCAGKTAVDYTDFVLGPRAITSVLQCGTVDGRRHSHGSV